ncbi:hypothetical protein [Candidatus Odyssella thessalonicensis]|uniref:hypothetical protein n=1 Tax=Candidatus Odyssella thessalonicensis TaxID=84647 RepID=UPI001FE1D231|nr:hypothetical protein [Candidatus Odyssella thessalonicensis]
MHLCGLGGETFINPAFDGIGGFAVAGAAARNSFLSFIRAGIIDAGNGCVRGC